tara:strand:+ start:298 stop:414 length:117 start_codon:yes stop_codon:yes gene_type:complete
MYFHIELTAKMLKKKYDINGDAIIILLIVSISYAENEL